MLTLETWNVFRYIKWDEIHTQEKATRGASGSPLSLSPATPGREERGHSVPMAVTMTPESLGLP